MKKKTHKQKKKNPVISLIIAGILLSGAFFAPQISILDRPMVSSILLICFAVFLWIRQPLPVAVVSLMVVILQPILGLSASLNDAFAGYSNAANFFVIASFGVAIAIRKTSVSAKILKQLLSFSEGRFRMIILAYMILAYVLSMIMSDIAAVMIAIAFAIDLVEGISDEMERKRMGRVLLLSLPIASIVGGTATPAGSTVNVMALNILSVNTGIEVSFFQWCVLGFPVSLLLLAAAWLLLAAIYPAGDISGKDMEQFIEKVDAAGVSSLRSEKAVLLILCLMAAAWIAGSWISVLNTTTVAIIGLALMMFPGIEAFTWQEFKAGVPWEIFLMGGATVSLGAVARQTGLVALLADTVRQNFTVAGEFSLIVILGLLVTLVLLLIPVGPATVSMLTMPIYAMVTALGLNPVMAVITVGAFASNSTILPLNAVMLLSYDKGYWKISELARIGVLLTIIWIVLAAVWFPAASNWVL